MPSKSTLAVVAVIAYGASVMALPVATNGRPDAAALAVPAVNATSAAAAVNPSLEQATNGTHSHHHHHHHHHHRHHSLTNEDGTPAEHHRHSHHHHHHGGVNATTPATQTPPADASAAQKVTDSTGSTLSRRDLLGNTPTNGTATTGTTPTPTPTHKESRKEAYLRHRSEQRAKHLKERADKQKSKEQHERQKLMEQHRKAEAKFLVEQEGIGKGHLKGKALRHAIEAKEHELAEKEKLAGAAPAQGHPSAGLPNSGHPASGALPLHPSHPSLLNQPVLPGAGNPPTRMF